MKKIIPTPSDTVWFWFSCWIKHFPSVLFSKCIWGNTQPRSYTTTKQRNWLLLFIKYRPPSSTRAKWALIWSLMAFNYFFLIYKTSVLSQNLHKGDGKSESLRTWNKINIFMLDCAFIQHLKAVQVCSLSFVSVSRDHCVSPVLGLWLGPLCLSQELQHQIQPGTAH